MNKPQVKILTYAELASTNTTAAGLGESAGHGTAVRAISQTAGRGQRGNTWESAPGLNATFSLILRPEKWPARRQFELSMAVSVAICRALEHTLGSGDSVMIKWPNDIYVGDRKLCGILIENSLAGQMLGRMIVGIGVNLNQTVFVSDAPNPVSLKQLTGREFDVEKVVGDVCGQIVQDVDAYVAAPNLARLSDEYHRRLWRFDGKKYKWLDAATGVVFDARITGVAPDGMFGLSDDNGKARTYAFKEVQAIL